MYERNAIVIDRHFMDLFGYDQNNNLKNNSNNYFELVSKLEEYQLAAENENDIINEFEKVASQIKETQKLQEMLNKKSLKYIETRKNLFENLEEDAEILNKKFDKVEEDINKNDDEIKTNIEKFVDEIKEFHEKTEIRTEYGRERRIKESDYQKILDKTTDNFSKISKERLKDIKTFVKTENKTEEKEKIKEEIMKNGAKEKVPFDTNVINKAIDVSTDIEQKKVEILLSIYDKTGKLLDEIKNDNIKIERHKKIVKDAKAKLEYLNVISEYVILFLDNERMNLIGGEAEHEKVMSETCENVQKDLAEIQNMYSLLIKEITDKSSKRAYKELYNLEYLFELQDAEKKFEANISKLNIKGSVIYPDYWRIEGMQKIYDTFKHLITDVYEKDLTEYEPLDITSAINEDILKIENKEDEEKNVDNIESDEEQDTDILPGVKEVEENDTEEDEETEENEEDIEDDDEEFQWDDDDIDDELNFDSKPIFDEEDDEDEDELDVFSNEDSNEDEEDQIEDQEIDKILGFFDDEEQEDDDPFDLEDDNYDDIDDIDDILGNEDDDEEDNIKFEEDDNTIKEENNKKDSKKSKSKNKENGKEKEKKKKSLFGRKK